MRLQGSVKFNLAKLTRLRGMTSGDSPEMVKWKKRSARKYRSFLYKRFDRFSRGGGDWKSTRRSDGRKKTRGRKVIGFDGRKRNAFILRQTHTLHRALSPVYRNLPGQYERLDRSWIEVGIGGQGKHPSGIKVAKLAKIHNNGEGIMPQRQIIVQPNSALVRDMRDDLDRTVRNG